MPLFYAFKNTIHKLLGVLLLLIASHGYASSAKNDDPGNWAPIHFENLSPDCQQTFAGLTRRETVYSPFRETRTLAFRKKPILFLGDMWIARGKALYIQYLEPRAYTVVITKDSIFRYTPNKEGTLSKDSIEDKRLTAVNTLLYALINAEFENLEQDFAIEGQQRENSWQLRLTPRSEDCLDTLKSCTLTGHSDTLAEIQFQRSSKSSITIAIMAPEEITSLPESLLPLQ